MLDPSRPKYEFTKDEYKAKINSPANSPVYFHQHIQPLVEQALAEAKDDHPVRVVDIACGHAMAMEFMTSVPGHEKIEITGIDLSPDALREARQNFQTKFPELKIFFVEADVGNELPYQAGSADLSTAINAMAYKQAHMLKSMFNALKSGGKAVINFFLPGKNQAYLDYYASLGCKIYERELQVESKGEIRKYKLLVTDFSQFSEPKMQKLGQQSFLQTTEDIEALAKFLGFEMEQNQPFEFFSVPINAVVVNDVYTLKKPENYDQLTSGQLSVHEQVIKIVPFLSPGEP
jgi:ubiquinone/menaquinone biosynthesis C-methylase UbiE